MLLDGEVTTRLDARSQRARAPRTAFLRLTRAA